MSILAELSGNENMPNRQESEDENNGEDVAQLLQQG